MYIPCIVLCSNKHKSYANFSYKGTGKNIFCLNKPKAII